MITHQLSLKGKAAADVAEVAINYNPLPSKHLTSERRSDHVCITSVSSEPLLEVYWTCRSGSISERLMGTPFVRLWTCKTGSISERLTRDPFGSLLDVQIWFNI